MTYLIIFLLLSVVVGAARREADRTERENDRAFERRHRR
jgi:hypothetical protein